MISCMQIDHKSFELVPLLTGCGHVSSIMPNILQYHLRPCKIYAHERSVEKRVSKLDIWDIREMFEKVAYFILLHVTDLKHIKTSKSCFSVTAKTRYQKFMVFTSISVILKIIFFDIIIVL